MKKEVLIAVLIGLSMGLVITYGIYRVQSTLNEPPVTDVAEVVEEAANALLSNAGSALVSIHSPEDGSIQSDTALQMAGTTLPNTFVVLFVNDQDFISTTDDSGNFSFSVELKRGTNVLNLHVVDSSGTITTTERVVVVTDLFSQSSSLESATESAELEDEASSKNSYLNENQDRGA